MAEIWERQKNESSKAYAVFCVYRDLGPERSLEKVRQNLDKPRTRKWLGDWSVKYNWVDRAAAYDDYIERRKREEKEKAILDMAERHAKLAMAFQQRVAQRLQGIDPLELSPSDMAKWLDIATKLERLSRGEPTEIGKQEVQGQVTTRHEYDIVQRIVTDPESRDIARDLFRRAISVDLEGGRTA